MLLPSDELTVPMVTRPVHFRIYLAANYERVDNERCADAYKPSASHCAGSPLRRL
jgi:hypothetical protein